MVLATPTNGSLTGESVHVHTLSRQADAHVPEGAADGEKVQITQRERAEG